MLIMCAHCFGVFGRRTKSWQRREGSMACGLMPVLISAGSWHRSNTLPQRPGVCKWASLYFWYVKEYVSHCHLFCLCCRDIIADVLMQDGFLIPTAEQLESLDIDPSGTNAQHFVFKAVICWHKFNLPLYLSLCRRLCRQVRPLSSSSVFALLVAVLEGPEFIHLYKSDSWQTICWAL